MRGADAHSNQSETDLVFRLGGDPLRGQAAVVIAIMSGMAKLQNVRRGIEGLGVLVPITAQSAVDAHAYPPTISAIFLSAKPSHGYDLHPSDASY